MTIAAVVLATALFFLAFQRSNLVALSLSVIRESNGAVRSLRDEALDDEAREKIAQRLALRLFAQFGRIMVATVLVCAPPLALLAALVYSGVTSSEDIWRVSTSWLFLAANGIVFAYLLAKGRWA